MRMAANMGATKKYSLLTQDAITPPPNRGRLWYDDEIPEQFFRGRVSVRWVRAHFPRTKGIKIGRDWAWYEADIVAWFEAQRGAARSGS